MRPHKVLLFIAAVMACLAVLCMVLPGRIVLGGTEVRWPTLAEVTGEGYTDSPEIQEIPDVLENPENLEYPEIPETAETAEAAVTMDSATVKKAKPVIPKITVDSTTDSRIFMQAFYASLSETGNQVVRVLHYGDSQIEEDRMTQQIREALQRRYGGSGVGLMPLSQTIPTRTMRQELFMSGRWVQPLQGPRRYMVYATRNDQRKDHLYGIMGQVAEMNNSLVSGSEEVMAVCTPTDTTRPYTRWQVFADSTVHYSVNGDTVRLNGKGKVYGLSQESDTGIIVDNIPMRGCLGLVFTKMDSTQISTFCQEQNVRLIILQFGGNAIPFNETPSTIHAIVNGLRKQVRYLQATAPEASILFIGPSDMLTQTDGEWHTYPMVPYIDRLLRRMALEENIGYFSLFRWMGGSGSMMRWQEVGLAGSDGVHFMRSGARKAGRAVAAWILEGVEIQKEIESQEEIVESQEEIVENHE